MRTLGVLLILFTGLLNFHIPHFLIEPASHQPATTLLEAVFLANVTAAVVSAVAIALRRTWGWRLGIVVAAASFLLYVAQETIGLPGLPKNWLEPSRIVAVVLEGLFVLVALRSPERVTRSGN